MNHISNSWSVHKHMYVDQEQRPYVPQSCCVKDMLWRYVNLEVCQTWRLGPPGSEEDGAINRALYYTVCWEEKLINLLLNWNCWKKMLQYTPNFGNREVGSWSPFQGTSWPTSGVDKLVAVSYMTVGYFCGTSRIKLTRNLYGSW